MWCRIALWDCFMDAMASLIGFYKIAQQSGSESARQTFPKFNSTHNDPVFQLKGAQLQSLSFRHALMQNCIIHLNLTMSSLASFLFSAAGLVFLSVSDSWKLKYQCKKVSTRVGTEEKNQ